MTRLQTRLALVLASALMATSGARAAVLNPFDTELSPDLHAFTSCNFVVNVVRAHRADCLHDQIVENPITLISVAGRSTGVADVATGRLSARATAHAYRFGVENLKANGGATSGSTTRSGSSAATRDRSKSA